jgi:mannose-6-phosphate isomerase-like protein (cupin superfamily)
MTIRGRDCVWGAVIGTVVVGLATTLSLRAAQGAPSQPPPLVIRGDAVPWLPAPGCGTTKFLVTGQQSGGKFAVLDNRQCKYVTSLHRHNHTDEAFYVVEGALNVFVAGAIHRLRAGDYVFVPRGMPHAQGNPNSTDNRVLVTVTPAGFEELLQYRADLLTKMKEGTPEFDKLMAAKRKDQDFEALGPTPPGLE